MPVAENGVVVTVADVVIGRWSNSSKTFTPGGSPNNAVQVIARRSDVNDNPVPDKSGDGIELTPGARVRFGDIEATFLDAASFQRLIAGLMATSAG